jgi:hypothetical protein
MLPKIIFGLILTIILGGFGLSQVDGLQKFLPQTEAQRIIEEGTSVEEAMDLYALKHDGQVDIGDPTLCPDNTTVGAADATCEHGQRTLHFVRQEKLLKNYVGKEFDSETDPWRYDEETRTIERVVSDEESCKEINSIKLGTSMNEDVPACDTAEGDAVYCCVGSS